MSGIGKSFKMGQMLITVSSSVFTSQGVEGHTVLDLTIDKLISLFFYFLKKIMTSGKRSWTWRQACDNPPQSHPVIKRVWILIAKYFHLQNIPMGLALSFHLLNFTMTTNLSTFLTTTLTTTSTWSRIPPCSATPHCQRFRQQRPACPSPSPAGRWSPR